MNLFALFFDNPLITKHARARLRPSVLVPICVVVGVLSLLIVLGAFVAYSNQRYYSEDRFGRHDFGRPDPEAAAREAAREAEYRRAPFVGALGLLLGFQGVVLLLGGTMALASSVSIAQDKGILDFHRISPQSPASMALGFLLGGPIREWLLFFLILPFALFMSLCAGISPLLYVQILLAQVTTALFFHTLALVVGLSRAWPRGTAAANVILVIGIHWLGGGMMMTGSWFPILLTSVPVTMQATLSAREFSDITPPAPFFGVRLPLLALTWLYQLPLLAFLFVMAVRKMRADRLHIFSKPLAVGFMLLTAFLTVGSVWSDWRVAALLVFLNVMTYVALALASNVTPTWGEFVTGLRRAAKLGQTRRPPWTDEAANPPAVALLAGILLLCGVAGWWLDATYPSRFPEPERLRDRPAFDRLDRPHSFLPDVPVLALAVAVGWLGAFGCATQYYQLVYGKGGRVAFRFFAFLAWGLPLLLSVLAGMANSSEGVAFFLALSPPSALFLTCLPTASTTALHWWGVPAFSQYLAAVVAVATAGIFAALLWGALRRAARAALRLQDAVVAVTVEPLGRRAPVPGPLLPAPEADARAAISPEGIRPRQVP
jgi:hypothetical protein